MAKKFPKTLYVKVEGDAGEEFFVSDDAIIALAEIGETIRIGVYKLIETTYAEVEVKTSGSRKPR